MLTCFSQHVIFFLLTLILYLSIILMMNQPLLCHMIMGRKTDSAEIKPLCFDVHRNLYKDTTF